MYARYLVFKYRLQSRDTGASMVEYALLVMLIALIAFVAVQVAGNAVSDSYVDIAESFPD